MENNVKKEKRRLLTVFDIVIIAVVVVLAALFLLWQSSKSAKGADGSLQTGGENVVYTIELANMEYPGEISVGDKLTETTKNTDIGTVKSYEYTDSMKWYTDYETGNQRMTSAGKTTLLLTVEAPCNVSDSAISTKAGAFEIRVGTGIGVTGPGYWGRGYIVAIERG